MGCLPSCCLPYPTAGPSGFIKPRVKDASKQYMKMPTFGNAEICYSLEGEEKAPLVLCLHGLEGAQWIWDKTVPFLVGKGYRVLRFDYFGHGCSELPPGQHDQVFYVSQIAEVLKALNLYEVPKTVIAHGGGGCISVLFVSSHPESVRNHILLAPAGFVESTAINCFTCCPCLGDCYVSTGTARSLIFSAIDRQNRHPEEAKWIRTQLDHQITNNSGFFTALFLALIHLPLSDVQRQARMIGELKDIRVLAIWGDRDGEGGWGTPIAHAKKYQSAIPQMELVTVKQGHHFFMIEDVSVVNSAIGDFLSKDTRTERSSDTLAVEAKA